MGTDAIRSACLSADGRLALVGCFGNAVRLWDLDHGRCLLTLAGRHRETPQTVWLSPDGRLGLSADTDWLWLWDLERGRARGRVRHRHGRLHSLCLSADGRLMLSAGWFDPPVKVWNAETCALVRAFEGDPDLVRAARFSPDGRFVVAGCTDGTIRVWEIGSGSCVRVLDGHQAAVQDIALTRDGFVALSGSEDGTMRLGPSGRPACRHRRSAGAMMRYSDGVALALRIARFEAWLGRAREVEPCHLLAGLSALCGADLIETRGGVLDPRQRRAAQADAELLRPCFAVAGIDPDTLRRRLRFALSVIDPCAPRDMVPHRSPAARRAFARAAELAAENAPAGAVELLRAVLESGTPAVQRVLERLGLSDPVTGFFPEARAKPAGGGQPAERQTPRLDACGRDLTRLAREGALPPLIGRRKEVRALARVLVKQRKASAVLVGEAGVGKTGIVEGLAARLAAPGAPAGLAGARIVELSMTALLAGASYRGEFASSLAGAGFILVCDFCSLP